MRWHLLFKAIGMVLGTVGVLAGVYFGIYLLSLLIGPENMPMVIVGVVVALFLCIFIIGTYQNLKYEEDNPTVDVDTRGE